MESAFSLSKLRIIPDFSPAFNSSTRINLAAFISLIFRVIAHRKESYAGWIKSEINEKDKYQIIYLNLLQSLHIITKDSLLSGYSILKLKVLKILEEI